MTPEELQQFQIAVAASTYLSTTARSSRECDNTNQLTIVSKSKNEEDLLWKKDNGKGGYDLVNVGKAFMPEWEVKKEAKGVRVDVVAFRFNGIQARQMQAAAPVPLYFYVDVTSDVSVTLLGIKVTRVILTKRWCAFEADFNTMKSGSMGCADAFKDVKVPSINDAKDPVSYMNISEDTIEASETARDAILISLLVLGLLIFLGALIAAVVLMRRWDLCSCLPCCRKAPKEEKPATLDEESEAHKSGTAEGPAAQGNRQDEGAEAAVDFAADEQVGARV